MGGSSVMAGASSGAAPSGGSSGTGGTAQQSGDGGDATTGTAGADGDAGGPPDVPDPPSCGNGKLEGDEECDDMGEEGNDGCDANCQVDCTDFGEEAVESADHHCYNGYDEATFEAAQADCVERGAHLVTISSPEENEIAASFVNTSKFIGGFEMVELMSNRDGTYEWVTGEPFEYENWAEEQPDREGSRCSAYTGPNCYEHCAAIDDEGLWMDQRCDLEDGYVCEWEPAGE
jgi:cysteine-rich repeat protein